VKLLLTGFEPFGGASINPSEQVVHFLNGKVIQGLEIAGCILPVDQVRGPAALMAALAQHQPDAVLCLGEGPRRAVISVERIAVNLLDFRIPDNAGNQVIDQPVVPGAPAAYFATLPERQVYEAILAAGIPVERSLTAGSYLCNQVLYTLLHDLSQKGQNIPAGFIHLPSLPQQAAAAGAALPSMSLETSCAGVWAAIEVIGQALHSTGGD
jgi:pyroglutamyl-peptidase